MNVSSIELKYELLAGSSIVKTTDYYKRHLVIIYLAWWIIFKKAKFQSKIFTKIQYCEFLKLLTSIKTQFWI